jgi:hypothetical protein
MPKEVGENYINEERRTLYVACISKAIKRS